MGYNIAYRLAQRDANKYPLKVVERVQLVLVDGRLTGGEIPGTPGQSCRDAAVFRHEVHG